MISKAVTLCPLCGDAARLLYRGTIDPRIFFNSRKEYVIAEGSGREKLDVYQCRRCGLGFSPHDMAVRELRDFYAGQSKDDEYLLEEQGRRKAFRRVLRRIGGMIPEKGKILDYGSGPAFFLDEARKDGWEIYGVEASWWAREYAKKHFGIALMTDDDFEKLPDGFFDAVTMFDVIEHVVSPADTLRHISKKLKSGGMIILTTPRFESLTRKVLKQRWYFMFPAHLWYFTKRSLVNLFRGAGMEPKIFYWHTFYFSPRYYLVRLFPFADRVFGRMLRNLFLIPHSLGEEWEAYIKKPEA